MPEMPSNPREALQQPLRAMESLGLHRPPSITLNDFLKLFVANGLLDARAVQRYLEVYHIVRFGAPDEQPARIEDAMEALLHGIEALREGHPGRLREAQALLQTPAPDPVLCGNADITRTSSEPGEEAENVQPSAAGAAGRVSFSGGDASSPYLAAILGRQRLLFGIGIALLWSLTMVWIGYCQKPRIDNVVARARYWLNDDAVPRPNAGGRLQQLRDNAVRSPGKLPVWLELANVAAEARQYGDAVIAYEHVLARAPDNAEVLNGLAWLLCVADDPMARDPVRALALAERAYTLDKAPHITDTLAEAAFQNGDVDRAIALEEDALARATGPKNFYEAQLARFQAGPAKAVEAE